jgi:hypothetical protein
MQPNPFEQGGPPQAPPANPFGGQPAAPLAPAYPQQYPASAPPAPGYPPQQQYAPQAPPQAAPPFPGAVPSHTIGGDPFRPPAPQVDRPRVQDLFGCLLLVMPKRIEYGITSRFRNPDGSAQKQDRMTADVVVLRGPDQSQTGGTPTHVPYGGTPEGRGNQYKPHDKWFAAPGKIDAMYISNKGLISQCREALEQTAAGRGQGMVLGVLDQGEAQGENAPPWLLRAFDESQAALARQWLGAHPVI